MTRLDKELTALAKMSPARLRDEWRRVYDAAAPLLSPELLRLGIGYRLQEKKHGGLPAIISRELDRARVTGAAPPQPSATPIRPGTQLIREWHGRTIRVLVDEGGFLFEERRYASLSGIAREVTGAQWSGPRFFGVSGHA